MGCKMQTLEQLLLCQWSRMCTQSPWKNLKNYQGDMLCMPKHYLKNCTTLNYSLHNLHARLLLRRFLLGMARIQTLLHCCAGQNYRSCKQKLLVLNMCFHHNSCTLLGLSTCIYQHRRFHIGRMNQYHLGVPLFV